MRSILQAQMALSQERLAHEKQLNLNEDNARLLRDKTEVRRAKLEQVQRRRKAREEQERLKR